MCVLTRCISFLATEYTIYARPSSSGTDRAEEHHAMKERLDLDRQIMDLDIKSHLLRIRK
jgi:hypothetical protein